jgi:putative membrane protein
MKPLLTFVRGFCMGTADIVPGVSGGTVALVLGIYERLLENVRRCAKAVGSLVKFDFPGIKRHLFDVEWSFLIPLLAGVGAALVALASLIEGLLETRAEEMAGLFLGLVGGSIVVAWNLLNDRSNRELAIMLVVGAVTFALLGFQSGPVADPSLPVFFGAGAIAICAMILPGISGSFLLLMMGMYAAVLGAAHDRSASDLVNLAVFFAGAVVGIALFSTALGWVLDRYHDQLLAGLIGLMLGSFRVLWPWPNGVGIISDVEGESISGTGLGLPETAGDFLAPTALAVVAFAIVVAVARFAPTHDDELAPGPISNTPV